ncbi:MAG: NADH-quinone oxidoreductase subunit A [Thermodesulfovibrionales bacterium]
METARTAAYWPLGVYLALAVITAVAMLVLSHLLGQRHMEKATGMPYESGMVATGTARVRFDVKYYLVAMFFVIFDLEAAFIFAWAISLREAGWAGYAEAAVFMAVLLAALLYLWKMGALDWAGRPRRAGRKEEGGA